MDQPVSQTSLDDFLGVKVSSPRRKFSKWGIIGGAVLLVLLLLWYVLGGTSAATSYATEPLAKGDLEVTVSATGNLAPTNKIAVGSETSGQVEYVYVEANDHVVKGQILARLDISKLTDAITRSRAAQASAVASVEQARATVQQTNTNKSRLQEVYRLSGGKVPSATELDTARAESARAVANLRAAEATVAQQNAQLNTDETSLAKASIRSPVTGVVLSRDIDTGQTVAASFSTPTLFTIAEDLSQMKLEVAVDEADVGLVAAGQRASFKVDAFPGRTFPADIQRVNLGSTTTTSTSSSSTVVSYRAVLAVANPEQILRPGMTATADIITSEHKDVFLVSNAALRFTPPATKTGRMGLSLGPPEGDIVKSAKVTRGAERQIYVVATDGTPRAINVVVGASNGNKTEVSGSDLKPGIEVISSILAAAK